MNKEETKYLELLQYILDHGEDRQDRTGVGTKSIFGSTLRFSLENNTLPLLTTKRVFIRGVIEELLFFIRGETDTKKLEAKGVNIWKGNTSREFLDKRGLSNYSEGQMGPMYGFNWTKFGCQFDNYGNLIKNKQGINQLKNCLDLIKNDSASRRIIVTAYNPEVSQQCVLDPCHTFFQFYVKNNKLHCLFYMRSSDSFLGFPMNLASYSMLTHLMAKASGLTAGEIIFMCGDIHIYSNHINQVKEQVSREPYSFPQVKINKEISSIKDMEQLEFTDFEIINYASHPAIKAPMAI